MFQFLKTGEELGCGFEEEYKGSRSSVMTWNLAHMPTMNMPTMYKSQTTSEFARSPVSKPVAATSRYPEIIVIIGCPRSGTKYLAAQLRMTMGIGFPTEPKFVVPTYRRLHRFGNLEEPGNLRGLVEVICRTRAFRRLDVKKSVPVNPNDILEQVREPTYTGVLYAVFKWMAAERGQPRLGYKDPYDTAHLPLLAELFPTGRFVHIIRDGRDVARSLLKFSWGSNNVYSGARYWAQTVAKARHDGAALRDRYFELRLEDLTFNTVEVATNLGQFINRGRDPEQVQALIERVERTKNPDLLNAWKQKMSARERYLCEAASGEVLEACGYPTEFQGKARISPLRAASYDSADFAVRVRNRLLRRPDYA
jgi:Sulfotransferase family